MAKSIPAILALFFSLIALTYADVITKKIIISPSEVSFEYKDGYQIPYLPDAVYGGDPGSPALPSIVQVFVLPPDAQVEKVEITDVKELELIGNHKIRPVQNAQTLSSFSTKKFTAPNIDIYSSDTHYPEGIIKSADTSSMSGIKLSTVTINPFKYKPNSGKLILITEATIEVHYRKITNQQIIISERQYQTASELLKNSAVNPDDINKYKPCSRKNSNDDVNYAIITDETLVKEFDSFKLWKTKKGYKTNVFSTSWIYSKYTGYDKQEKIRNFLIDYQKNHGLIYCLLAGDDEIVPARKIMAADMGGQKKEIATDFYYSDLDGSWDADGDHIYGEHSSDLTCDGIADIFVGRAPIDNITDVKTFIHKDTTMEKHPQINFMQKLLLPSMTLVENVYHGREISNAIAEKSPSGWFDSKIEPKKSSQVVDSINSGYYLIHLAAHGVPDGLGWEKDTMLFITDVPKLTNNKNNFSILFSISCLIGHFDSKDCITEALMNAPKGGCVAAVTNSREGMSSGSINENTEALIIGFATEFFKNNIFEIGKCFAAAKNNFNKGKWKTSLIDYLVSTPLNLFGDPDLPMFKESPVALSATHVNSANKGQQSYTITVKKGNSPVSGARVCCFKDGEVHQTDTTNASGAASLSINPTSEGTMFVTATAMNCTPYEGICNVSSGNVSLSPEKIISLKVGINSIAAANSRELAIKYTVNNPSKVSIKVFDSNGKTLLFKTCDAISGNNITNIGVPLANGIYFISVDTKEFCNTFKWALYN